MCCCADAVPVLEGQLQPSAAVRLPYGGRHLTSHLKDLLARRGVICSEEEAEKIKVACLRVAPSAADAAAGTPELPGKEDGPPPRPTSYTLADGSTIDVAKEVLELGEALLDPSRLGLDLPPLAQTVQTAGMVTTVHGEKEARRALAENLLVCGGGAAIPGLAERLLSEVTSLAHPSLTPALCPIPDYMPSHTAQRAGWMGGALLAKVVFSTTSAHQVQHPVLKVDYEESGPSVVHRKCC